MNQPIDNHDNQSLAGDIRQYVNSNTHFTGAGRAGVLASALQYIRSDNDSVCVIAGPKGIGKTNMLGQLRSQIESESCCISLDGYFDNLDTLLELLMRRLGLVDRSSSSTQQCLDIINQAMEGFQDKRPLVLLFDDAHQMPIALIRRLAALARDQLVRLRVVLAMDQEQVPEFDQLLQNQRMLSLSLCRVPRSEMQHYLGHRYGPQVKFDELEISAIFQESAGIPKKINEGAAALTSNRVVQSGTPALDLPTLAPLAALNREIAEEDPEENWFAYNGVQARASAGPDRDAMAAYMVALSAAAFLTVAVAGMTLLGSFADDKANNNGYVYEAGDSRVVLDTRAASRQQPSLDNNTQGRYAAYTETAELAMPVAFPGERIIADSSAQTTANELMRQDEALANMRRAADGERVLLAQGVGARDRAGLNTTTPEKTQQRKSPSDEQLLLDTEPGYFVLQFVAGSSQTAVQRYIDQYDELQLKMFADKVKGKTVYKAVSKGFPNVAAAQSAISNLPAQLRKDKPWVRSVASVHKEIRRGRSARPNAKPMPPGSQLAAVVN